MPPTIPAARGASMSPPARPVRLRAAEQAGQKAGALLDRLAARGHGRGGLQLAGDLAVLLEVALVVLLGAPERGRVADLGRDRLAQMRLHGGQRLLGDPPL